jgi:gamma-glutamyltranspeptidase/glutathione hydrolase
MIYLADSGTVETISGLGWWPKAATINFFEREQGGRIRRGVNRCVLPSAIDAWLMALERHGTVTFADVAAPAIELADDGFPMHDVIWTSCRRRVRWKACASGPRLAASSCRMAIRSRSVLG